MSQSPHQIVSIDDNSADTQLLRLAFDQLREPYVLKVLPDGEAAIQYLREYCGTKNRKPCLIIIDLHLPKYDGITVLRTIRSHPDLADVTVAVLTSQASPREHEAVLSLGVSFYGHKPMNWEETMALARELFNLCSTPRSLAALV
ncbi:MAG TPA: response regulator [Bryobacteraceae bacterium]|jgi:hypothetical protein